MSSIKKSLLVSIAIIVFSTLVALLVVEAFLYWDNYFKPFQASIVTIEDKKYPFQYSIDSLSEKNHSNTKPKIFLIGDSFVAGVQCTVKGGNIAEHLQKIVGNSVEVVNLGVGGKDPSNYIDFLNHFDVHKGDKVFVFLYDNDIHMSRETCELTLRQQKIFPIYSPSFCKSLALGESDAKDGEGFMRQVNQILKRFKTFELLKEAAYNLPYISNFFYRTEYLGRWNNYISEENRWIISTIPVMKSLVQNKGAEFTLLYYPNTNSISTEDLRHQIWLDFKGHLFDEKKINLNDPYPFFIQNSSNRSMVWSLTDKHPSCNAHLLMAKYLNTLMGN